MNGQRNDDSLFHNTLHPIGFESDITQRCNWKVKQNLPITYPGHATESVQLAWEAWSQDEKPMNNNLELLNAVCHHGLLLPSQVGIDPRVGPLTPSLAYTKIEWSAFVGHTQESIIPFTHVFFFGSWDCLACCASIGMHFGC